MLTIITIFLVETRLDFISISVFSPKGAFNNYLDQILLNFDPPPLWWGFVSSQTLTFYYYLPFVTWPPMEFLLTPSSLPPLFVHVVIECPLNMSVNGLYVGHTVWYLCIFFFYFQDTTISRSLQNFDSRLWYSINVPKTFVIRNTYIMIISMYVPMCY